MVGDRGCFVCLFGVGQGLSLVVSERWRFRRKLGLKTTPKLVLTIGLSTDRIRWRFFRVIDSMYRMNKRRAVVNLVFLFGCDTTKKKSGTREFDTI